MAALAELFSRQKLRAHVSLHSFHTFNMLITYQWRIYIVKFWMRAPRGSKFFQFHAVFGKIWQNRMLAPPLESWRPLLGEILDPPLLIYFEDRICTLRTRCRSFQYEKDTILTIVKKEKTTNQIKRKRKRNKRINMPQSKPHLHYHR